MCLENILMEHFLSGQEILVRGPATVELNMFHNMMEPTAKSNFTVGNAVGYFLFDSISL